MYRRARKYQVSRGQTNTLARLVLGNRDCMAILPLEMAHFRNKGMSCGPRVWGIASLNCVANASSEAMDEKSLASAARSGLLRLPGMPAQFPASVNGSAW